MLPTVYLLEPVNKTTLIQIVAFAIENEPNAYSSTSAALSMLTKKRYIESTANGFILTSLGKKEFFSFKKKNSRNKQHGKTIAIDGLRLEILNLKYRNKKLKD